MATSTGPSRRKRDFVASGDDFMLLVIPLTRTRLPVGGPVSPDFPAESSGVTTAAVAHF